MSEKSEEKKVIDIFGNVIRIDGTTLWCGENHVECGSPKRVEDLFGRVMGIRVVTGDTPKYVVAGWLVTNGIEKHGITAFNYIGETFRISHVDGGYNLTKNGVNIGTFETLYRVSEEIIWQSPCFSDSLKCLF